MCVCVCNGMAAISRLRTMHFVKKEEVQMVNEAFEEKKERERIISKERIQHPAIHCVPYR